MRKKDLEKMTLDEKRAMRREAARIAGEKIAYEEELKKLKEEEPKEEEEVTE